MTIPRAWQRGQALVEALVLLPVLILSFMAVAWLGRLLFSAQVAGVASRSAAMAAAVGGGVPVSYTHLDVYKRQPEDRQGADLHGNADR